MTIVTSREYRVEGNDVKFSVYRAGDPDSTAVDCVVCRNTDSPLIARLMARYDRPHEFSHHLTGPAAHAFSAECVRLFSPGS